MFVKKIRIEKLTDESVNLVLRTICMRCEKNEFCNSANKNDLCIRLDTISKLLKDEIKINNMIIIDES